MSKRIAQALGAPHAAIAFAALALAAPIAGHAGFSVSGNTISWDNDGGWYQVQNPATSQWNLCNSSINPNRSCTVPNGTYVVINHSTGARDNNVAVPAAVTDPGTSGTTEGYSVNGNTISWANDGWYQIQRPATGQWNLCNSSDNPGRSCTVPDGEYTIINHTTGVRASNVAVPQGTTTGPTSGAGSNTGALTAQPGSTGTCNTDSDNWEFLPSTSRNLVSGFQGWCNPGGGISTRAYAPGNWQGQATVNTGTPGRNFWIDWQNTGSNSGHSEFDISMSRRSSAQGYGQTRLSNMFSNNRDLRLTARANWMQSKYTNSAAPVGKSHIQTIIWLAREQGADANAGRVNGQCVDRQTIDITVVDYMSALQRAGYFDGTNWPANTQYAGDITIPNGTYKVYRRTPGDICEVSSYLAIRTTDKFSTTSAKSEIDARPFIDLAINEGFASSSWNIATMGWEIAGASADGSISGLGNSAGKMVFSCYSIPSLNGTGSGNGYARCQ